MRVLALTLAFLVPIVTSAQTVEPISAVSEDLDPLPLDVAPAVGTGEVIAGVSLLVSLVLLAYVIGEDGGYGWVCLGGLFVVGGAIAVCNQSAPPGDLGEGQYDVDALLAFGEGQLSDEQRSALAATAHRRGTPGVVLRRLVPVPVGVGAVPKALVQSGAPQLELEVAVVDAETGRFRAFNASPLMSTTVQRVRLEGPLDDRMLEEATAQALSHLSD